MFLIIKAPRDDRCPDCQRDKSDAPNTTILTLQRDRSDAFQARKGGPLREHGVGNPVLQPQGEEEVQEVPLYEGVQERATANGKLTDDEVRERGYEPTRRGWVPITDEAREELAAGSVRLVDRRTRVVEVLGPEPMGAKRPTDRELLLDEFTKNGTPPQRVGLCIQARDRQARSSSTRRRVVTRCSTCSPGARGPRSPWRRRMGPRAGWSSP